MSHQSVHLQARVSMILWKTNREQTLSALKHTALKNEKREQRPGIQVLQVMHLSLNDVDAELH